MNKLSFLQSYYTKLCKPSNFSTSHHGYLRIFPKPLPIGPVTTVSYKNTIIILLMMLSTFLALNYFQRVEDNQLKRPISTFPMQLGDWAGTTLRFDQQVYDVLGVDDSLLRRYTNHGGQSVQLYMGYYKSQREGRIIHSPKNCMPGAGWNIIHNSVQHIQIPGGNPSRVTVVKLILEKGTEKQVAMYWFQARGRYVASEYLDKIYLILDALILHRTDEAFVRLLGPVQDGDPETTTGFLKEFIQRLVPVLEDYVPS
ncbi:MAG: exosortase C-terminal domain/associated protein EpsI [Smithellaceae bacterium]